MASDVCEHGVKLNAVCIECWRPSNDADAELFSLASNGSEYALSELHDRYERLQKDIRSLAIKPTTDWPLNETGGARMRPDGRLGCIDCGELYGGPRFPDLVIDDESFAKVAPNPPDGGLVCPNCLNARLEAAGLFGVPAAFMSGAFANDDGPAVKDLKWVRESFKKLKAENERLRKALQSIAREPHAEYCHGDFTEAACNCHKETARKALAAAEAAKEADDDTD